LLGEPTLVDAPNPCSVNTKAGHHCSGSGVENGEENGVGGDLNNAPNYFRMEGQAHLLGGLESMLDQEPAAS
jgi:hypothetical protein